MVNEVSDHITAITKSCVNYGVKHLYVFESNAKTEINFIIDFFPIDPLEYADNYYNLKLAFENILNVRINLLEENAIKNPYFLHLVNNKKKILFKSEAPVANDLKIEEDYQNALIRLDEIFDAQPGSPEGDELEALGILIDSYEKINYPMNL
jgi:predicted nucleotidyltransferase